MSVLVGHELGRVGSAESQPDLLTLPSLPKVLRLRRRQPSSQPWQTAACGLELDARGGCTGHQECQLPAARYASVQTAQKLLSQLPAHGNSHCCSVKSLCCLLQSLPHVEADCCRC